MLYFWKRFNSMSKNIFCLLFLSLLFISCEKDDICNEGTPGTPNLVIRFFDKDNPAERKVAENISIKEINQEQIYRILSSDSVTIPMDLSKNFTRYAFILPSSTTNLIHLPHEKRNFSFNLELYFFWRFFSFLQKWNRSLDTYVLCASSSDVCPLYSYCKP